MRESTSQDSEKIKKFFKDDYIITVGKFGGLPISKVPTDHLKWMKGRFSNSSKEFKAACDELVKRYVLGEAKLEDLTHSVMPAAIDNKADVMTFGKYKGQKLSEIPESYLKWALTNVDTMPAALKRKIQAIIEKSTDTQEFTDPKGNSHEIPSDVSMVETENEPAPF